MVNMRNGRSLALATPLLSVAVILTSIIVPCMLTVMLLHVVKHLLTLIVHGLIMVLGTFTLQWLPVLRVIFFPRVIEVINRLLSCDTFAAACPFTPNATVVISIALII